MTGGIFKVTILHLSTEDPSGNTDVEHKAEEILVWDRETEGGFPETKELKNRVRNLIDPGRDLGHIDRSLKKGSVSDRENEEQVPRGPQAGGVPGGGDTASHEVAPGEDDKGGVEK